MIKKILTVFTLTQLCKLCKIWYCRRRYDTAAFPQRALTPYYTSPSFPFPFLLRRAKKQLRRLWERVERNAEAKRSGDADPPRARFIWSYPLHRNARRWPARAGRSRSEAEARRGAERE